MMLRAAVSGMIMGASILFGAAVVFPVIAKIDSLLFPVLVDWRVTEYQIDGKDLIISGKVVKQYDCDYMPPPRARDLDSGRDLLVDSESLTKLVSWPASPIPRPYGPWRVINGAGKEIKFWQMHRCNPLWTKTVELGEFKTIPSQ